MALVVSDPVQQIDTRREIHDKFAEAMVDLSLVSHVGDPRYEEEPAKAIQRMREVDQTFHTDIQSEIQAIELRLRRQQLEGQWVRDHQHDPGEHAEEEKEAWVEDQLHRAGGGVNCKLPQYTPQVGRGGTSTLGAGGLTTNEAFSTTVESRAEKLQVHDRVSVGGRVGTIQRFRGEHADISWEDGDSSTVETRNCSLIGKAHPAKVVTSLPPARQRRPYSGPAPHSQQGASELSALFSQEGSGSSPGWVRPPPQNRRQQVEEKKKQYSSKMPSKRDPAYVDPQGSPKRRIGPAGASRFMQVHQHQEAFAERELQKDKGQPVGLAYLPDTLCVCDNPGPGPAAQLLELRGMRVTHVSPTGLPVGPADEVHTAAALRQQLAKCQESTVVGIRAEPWSQRRTVEKKKREFQEKLATAKTSQGVVSKK
eukprot:TRINITY_DN40176_c0_g1_i1.p1 TRINITY_DN40176_c0_g1~~TRINITY_DN40176_c0_g1_i1.p1  ORF type:complete len:424 (+),score=145.54 TRINITY_DN40176_c0_g1_i1:98-1369(+)